MLPQFFSYIFFAFISRNNIYISLLILGNFVIQKLNIRLLRNFKGIMKFFSINLCYLLKGQVFNCYYDTNYNHKIHLFNIYYSFFFSMLAKL